MSTCYIVNSAVRINRGVVRARTRWAINSFDQSGDLLLNGSHAYARKSRFIGQQLCKPEPIGMGGTSTRVDPPPI